MSVRRAGLLLPVTSLSGAGGIGDLGPGARRFLDFLAEGGQSLWQMLPVGVTSPAFGNSPYSALGAFGIDPLLIAPEDLAEDGLLDPATVARLAAAPSRRIDHAAVRAAKGEAFAEVDLRWRRASRLLRDELERFRERAAYWLEDLARFLARREAASGRAWPTWGAASRGRPTRAIRLAAEHHVRLQFLAHRQWERLRAQARRRGVLLVGDLPLYVGHDSADVWRHPSLFALDEEGRPSAVAGVPPDYFSDTGQLWGHPVYRWTRHAEDGYAWWRERLGYLLGLFDAVRLDHFRGLAAYWEVPAGAETAREGRWVPGPGASLLETLVRALPHFSVIAEDLGVIDAEVRELRRTFGLPGMRVLQFAFGDDFPRSEHLPAFHEADQVVYTGTHDNDTTRGWFEHEAEGAPRERLFRYLGRRLEADEAADVLLRLAHASVASWAVVPLQDVLGLGSAARLNRPGRAEGNWRWRAGPRALATRTAERLRDRTWTYGRGGP